MLHFSIQVDIEIVGHHNPTYLIPNLNLKAHTSWHKNEESLPEMRRIQCTPKIKLFKMLKFKVELNEVGKHWNKKLCSTYISMTTRRHLWLLWVFSKTASMLTMCLQEEALQWRSISRRLLALSFRTCIKNI